MGKSSGGNASAPSAPNLSGNINTANNISNTATSDASQTFNTAQAYNANAQNNLSSVVGAETPVMSNVNAVTNQNLNTYGSTFAPLQQTQAADAQNYVAQNADRLRGQAIADQGAAAGAARANSAAALASEGVDPASIRGGALDQQASLAAAAAEAGAGTNSQLNTENTGRQLVSQANQLGLQVGQQANQGAQVGSAIGAQTVQDTNATNSTGINNLTANTGQLNTGVNANSSAVSAANTQFQDQNTAYQNTQAAKSSAMGALGSVAGGALNFVSSNPGVLAKLSKGGTVTHHGALPFAPLPDHPTDTKPALLTPGEYVIPRDVAQHKGHEFFHRLVDKARGEIANRQAIPHAPSAGV